jgi:hypothetical protein
MKPFCAVLALTALATGCSSPSWTGYGGEMSDAEAVPVATVLAHPEQYDGRSLVVVGTPSEVCQRKGCWMLFAEGGREMRVTFKDYGFFVPKETAGREVRCDGTFSIGEIPPALAMHYLEDAGRYDDASKIRGPVLGYTFVADSVQIRGE